MEEPNVKGGELRSRSIVLSHDAGSHVTYVPRNFAPLGAKKKIGRALRKRWEIGESRFIVSVLDSVRVKHAV